MNLIVNDYDHPLIIKVASIPQIRIQVYFMIMKSILKRNLFLGADGNISRIMMKDACFSVGFLETVKKLGWILNLYIVMDG